MFGSFSPESVEKFKSMLDFAECEEGEKMVFGACRKMGAKNEEKDFDSSKKTKNESDIENEGAKQGSSFESNKPFMKDGEKYGWAMKDGKKVAVKWGAVAGEKKVGPEQPQAGEKAPKTANPKQPQAGEKAPKTANPQPTPPSPTTQLANKANDPTISERDRSVASIALKVAAQQK
jgi:hypothetical protein